MDDTSMTHLSPTLQELEDRDARRLIVLLAQGGTLASIRDEAFPDRSIHAARVESLRLAQRDVFGAALQQRMPPLLQDAARDLWMAWRDQDERIAPREQLRSLRRMVADLDSLASTVRSLRPARKPEETSSDVQREPSAWS